MRRVPDLDFSRRGARLIRLLCVCLCICGCDRPADVVIYTSVDQEFAEQIIRGFERQSGLKVAAVFDTEAGKTTGLLRRLQRESGTPRCDVWWSSEIFGTIELARAGVFESFEAPSAADVPTQWKDPQGRWIATAARARVLAFNPARIRRSDLPVVWRELLHRDWNGRLAVANPLFGTTRGHLAAMFAEWGNDTAQNLLRRWAAGDARLADGNSQSVALLVAGQVDAAMTDTDDVWVAQARGAEIDLIYPALDENRPAVWIPCSVAVVRGAPHPAAARRLADYLVSAAVEEQLARSASRNVPVREALREKLRMNDTIPETPELDRIVDALPAAADAARDILMR